MLHDGSYQALFERNPQPMWVWDCSSRRFLAVNNAASNFYGFSREEFLAMFVTDIRPDEDRERFEAYAELFTKSEHQSKEGGVWLHRKKNGDLAWMDVIHSRITFDGRTAVLALLRDVTHQRLAEQARVAAETELRQSRDSLREAQALVHLGSWELDLVAGQVIEEGRLTWSDEAYRIFGFEPQECRATSALFWSLVHPDDQDKVKAAVDTAFKTGGIYEVEHRIVRRDKTTRVVREQGKFVLDRYKRPVRLIGTVHDISERAEMERRIVEMDRMYRQILDSIHDLVLVKGPKSHIRWANKAFLSYYGMSNEQLADIIDAPDVEPDITQQYVRDDQRVFESGKSLDIPSEPIRRHDGMIRFFHTVKSPIFDADGRVAMTVGVSRDITERQQGEERLRESETRFRQLAESIDEVFWMTDIAKQTMLYISPSYERIWGRTCQSVYDTPMSFLDAIHPDDRVRVVAALSRQSTGDYDLEYRIVRPDGEIRHIRDRAFPIRDSGGHVIRVAGIAEDITAQKELQARVVQSEKMSAVGQLAAGVAHEINNPLGVILGFAQSLRRRSPSDDPRDPLASIEREALRCKALVQNLLAFSRHSKSELAPESPHAALDGALLLVETQARIRRVEIRRAFEQELPAILSDRNDFQQVLINLCTNAMDAMEKGGTLTVGATTDGDWLVLRVTDTGPGIPTAVRSRVFEPFFTTKEVGKGTGLGLSLVYETVKRHGGTVHFECPDGGGTTFIVRLPVYKPSLKRTALDDGAAAA